MTLVFTIQRDAGGLHGGEEITAATATTTKKKDFQARKARAYRTTSYARTLHASAYTSVKISPNYLHPT